MANKNPNTSGLMSLADRPNNERTTIAKQGGLASGQKRKEIKRMSDIILGFRKESEEDPVEKAIKFLFNDLTNPFTTITDTIKGLKFIKEICAEDSSDTPTVVYKYITPEEQKEINEHIDSVIGDTCDEPDNNEE